MSASTISQASERFEFRKESPAMAAKLMARVAVMLISFAFVFGGAFEWTVRHFGKSGPMAVMAFLVALIFLMPRLILRLSRETLVISAFGVTRSRGAKKIDSISHHDIAGFKIQEFRFGAGSGSGISIIRKGEMSLVSIPAGFADAQDLEAALSRFFPKI